MARLEYIERRLLRWAEYVAVGDGSGYPSMSVLHKNWQPPAPGTSPTLKVAAPSDARETHRAIKRLLSQRQANTLVVHYVMKLPMAEQVQLLECAAATIYQRIETAHRLLARGFYAQ